MLNLVLIFVLFALGLYWWDSRRCHEEVLRYCQQECERSGVQLLDYTVSHMRFWCRRSQDGWPEFCHLYGFEYCDDNESRRHGYVVLQGGRITEIRIPD